VRFVCPKSMQPHAQKVLAGEYDIPGLEFGDRAPVILDIGANVGSFALWAARRWDGAFIHCYEPHPVNAKMLRANLGMIELGKVIVHEVAVTPLVELASPEHWCNLYEGRNNCGEASLYPGSEQTRERTRVRGMHPVRLPSSDILKMDCEGEESGILAVVLDVNSPMRPSRALMYEWHGTKNRYECGALASRWYECVSDIETCIPDVQPSAKRGIAKWVQPSSKKVIAKWARL
jgi:FkbM family methyltransferase